jgi:hypothetical protein
MRRLAFPVTAKERLRGTLRTTALVPVPAKGAQATLVLPKPFALGMVLGDEGAAYAEVAFGGWQLV